MVLSSLVVEAWYGIPKHTEQSHIQLEWHYGVPSSPSTSFEDSQDSWGRPSSVPHSLHPGDWSRLMHPRRASRLPLRRFP